MKDTYLLMLLMLLIIIFFGMDAYNSDNDRNKIISTIKSQCK